MSSLLMQPDEAELGEEIPSPTDGPERERRSQSADFMPSLVTGLLGLLGLVISVVMLSTFASGWEPKFGVLLMVAMTALPMALYDTLVLRVQSHPSSGLSARLGPVSFYRCCVKWAGLAGTLGLVAFFYWLFPEYGKDFYRPFFEGAKVLAPACLVLAVPYMIWVDRRMAEPCDGYWQMGLALTGRWGQIDASILKSHLAGWAVKAFFLPLMSVFLMQDIEYLQSHPLETGSFALFFPWAHNLFFIVDLGFACVGYLLTLRLFNSQIRTTESTALGWASALACYQPFWASLQQLYFNYRDGTTWTGWLANHSTLYLCWGWLILAVLSIYSFATVCFGLRFSNLTHRGIIRYGPYAWTRHPAYVAKLTHHFLVSVPFVMNLGGMNAIRQCCLFSMVALIYVVRAKTEERHLSHDAAYRQYSEEIRQRHARMVLALKSLFRPRPAKQAEATAFSNP